MSFFTKSTARHRAATESHVVRNSAIAAATAGVAVAGAVAPANASSGVIELGGASQAASTSSLQSFGSYTYQPSVSNGVAANQNASLTGMAASTSVSTQSNANTSGIVGTAYAGVGYGYVYGGPAVPGQWDCSSFVQWVYAQHGINLPRTTWSQFASATPTANPQPGDLVSQNGGGHVGIYIGNGQMISALNPMQGTQVHSVNAMQLDGFYTVR